MKTPATNTEWKKWGEKDPLYGVASWKGREKSGANPWTEEEFYALGQSDWQDFLAQWEKYGLERHTCLEIGCGAGRLTRQMADSFEQVIAVDVSEGMLSFARQHVPAGNVSFVLANGTQLPGEDRSVSAVFSTHVFQHFDSLQYASAYFREIQRILTPGGTLMIHMPVHQWPVNKHLQGLFNVLMSIENRFDDADAWLRRQLIQRNLAKPIMRYRSYPLQYFYATLPQIGFADIEIKIFPVSSNQDMHPFVFARKA
jgi:ubiquinone/menaquinone biosynthesis C-methylase UbiE